MTADATRPADDAANLPQKTLPLGDSGASLARTLRRRRGLRVGIVQMAYIVLGVVLGVVLPTIHSGPTIAPETVSPVVLGIAGGFVSFIALVFSLLFLVVQYGNTTVSPRLTLFRDAPIVWHSFGLFMAVFVYATIAAVQLGTRDEDVTVLVPALAITLVIVALMLSRTLQMRALRQLQLPATMEEVRRRGAALIDDLYRSPFAAAGAPAEALPPVQATLRWERAGTTVREIDVRALLAEAQRVDALLDIHVTIGAEVHRNGTIATVHAERPVGPVRVHRTLSTGIDRSFAQDPLLAFRLLSDIGNRALSAAVNDPATAVQVLACVQDLLTILLDRQLDIGDVRDPDGRLRLRLRMPTWEEFLRAGVDEIAYYGQNAPIVRERVGRLLEALLEHAPPERRSAVERRLAALTHNG